MARFASRMGPPSCPGGTGVPHSSRIICITCRLTLLGLPALRGRQAGWSSILSWWWSSSSGGNAGPSR
eukprot:1629311-Heterocapsa_arctica.AAC.1